MYTSHITHCRCCNSKSHSCNWQCKISRLMRRQALKSRAPSSSGSSCTTKKFRLISFVSLKPQLRRSSKYVCAHINRYAHIHSCAKIVAGGPLITYLYVHIHMYSCIHQSICTYALDLYVLRACAIVGSGGPRNIYVYVHIHVCMRIY